MESADKDTENTIQQQRLGPQQHSGISETVIRNLLDGFESRFVTGQQTFENHVFDELGKMSGKIDKLEIVLQQQKEAYQTGNEEMKKLLQQVQLDGKELERRVVDMMTMQRSQLQNTAVPGQAPGEQATPDDIDSSNEAQNTAVITGATDLHEVTMPPHTECLSRVHGPITTIDFAELTDLVKIGDGSFCKVYRVRHSSHPSFIAYKEIGAAVTQPGSKLAREMRREVNANSLQHKNIVATLGMVFQGGHYGILLEYAEYGNLDSFIENQNKIGWFTMLSFASGVACGLAHLHAMTPTPVVHGDIKVHNVLVAQGFVAKIGSFGLSKWKQFSTANSPTTIYHPPTITNLSPEQFNDINESRTPKCDVYGFAILLWQMFSRCEPFNLYFGQYEPIRLAVIGGQRPPIDAIMGKEEPSMPEQMFKLAKRIIEHCWKMKACERPDIKDVHMEFDKFLNENITDVNREMKELELAVAAAAAAGHVSAVGDSSK